MDMVQRTVPKSPNSLKIVTLRFLDMLGVVVVVTAAWLRANSPYGTLFALKGYHMYMYGVQPHNINQQDSMVYAIPYLTEKAEVVLVLSMVAPPLADVRRTWKDSSSSGILSGRRFRVMFTLMVPVVMTTEPLTGDMSTDVSPILITSKNTFIQE